MVRVRFRVSVRVRIRVRVPFGVRVMPRLSLNHPRRESGRVALSLTIHAMPCWPGLSVPVEGRCLHSVGVLIFLVGLDFRSWLSERGFQEKNNQTGA